MCLYISSDYWSTTIITDPINVRRMNIYDTTSRVSSRPHLLVIRQMCHERIPIRIIYTYIVIVYWLRLTGTSQFWTSASCSLQLLWCNLISDEKGARHPGVSTKYLCTTVPTVRIYTDDISRSSGSDVFVYNVTSWKPFGLHNKRSSRRTQRRRRSDNISAKGTK